MQVTQIFSEQRKEWNSFAAQEPFFAITQSWEWGEFKEKLGWRVIRLAIKEQDKLLAGAQMLIKSIPTGMASIAYIPRGPVGNWQNKSMMSVLLTKLVQVAQQHRAIFLRIEPAHLNTATLHQFLYGQNFQPNSYTNQPRATIILDLTQDLDDILGQMRRSTRYNIRYASRKGVTINTGNQEDIPAFYDLMQATGRRAHFSPRIYTYYQQEWDIFSACDRAKLFLASYQDQLLGARMIFRFGNQAADIHAGSITNYSKLRPNYLLVWEAIKWAKAQGCTTYDLWGIPDEVGQAVYEGKELPKENRNDNLWGVYEFKRGFGKNVVYYTGAYDYVLLKPLYWLVANRFFENGILDTIATRLDLLRKPGVNQ